MEPAPGHLPRLRQRPGVAQHQVRRQRRGAGRNLRGLPGYLKIVYRKKTPASTGRRRPRQPRPRPAGRQQAGYGRNGPNLLLVGGAPPDPPRPARVPRPGCPAFVRLPGGRSWVKVSSIFFLPGRVKAMTNLRLPPSIGCSSSLPPALPSAASGHRLRPGRTRRRPGEFRGGLPLPDKPLSSKPSGAAPKPPHGPPAPVFNLGTVLPPTSARPHWPRGHRPPGRGPPAPCALEYDLASGGRGDRDDLVSPLLAELVANGDPGSPPPSSTTTPPPCSCASTPWPKARRRWFPAANWWRSAAPSHPRRDAPRPGASRRGRHHQPHPRRRLCRRHRPEDGLLMKVHTSNYAVTGFTKAVDAARGGAQPAHAAGLPFWWTWGRHPVRFRRQRPAAGTDAATGPGRRRRPRHLLRRQASGRPQAGLIVGRRELVARIKKNPLKRALRVGRRPPGGPRGDARLYRDRIACSSACRRCAF